MINNYFLLYHSANYKQADIGILLNTNDEDFDEISAFILSLSFERLEYFLEFDEFKKLSKKVITNGFLDSSSLFDFCFLVLKRIEKNVTLVSVYLKVFSHLVSVGLLTKIEEQSLKSIFASLQVAEKSQDKERVNFLDSKEFIESSINKVRDTLDSKKLTDDLESLSKYLQKKVFSIGITGVMNVGKSSFINALIQKELLGSSVVAETANLSVLKYSKEAYAKVRFFNSLEFDELSHTRETPLSDTVDVERYIQDKSLVIDVKEEELQRYTSATDAISEIVKNVELGVDLEFLKDSIEIVDTPGLDDTLIVRETITKTYVQNCDLLIHLMNVNQSATQKDVDFLVESANNQNLSSILILLTKEDNITQDELAQVMSYTKKTILSQLSTTVAIEFMSISASKNRGIKEVKDYLYHTLFDSSIKNESLINNSSIKLKIIIDEQIQAYNYILLLYSKDESSLELELREFNATKETNKRSIQKINAKIDSEFKEYGVFVDELDSSVDSDMKDLKNKLQMRVVDELSYSLKNKRKVKERQLLMLIDKSISHGYIDVIREYKYKLKNYMLNVSKKIELSFKEHNIKVQLISDEDSMSELFGKNSNSSLNTSIKMISKRLNPLVKDVKNSQLEKFKEQFSRIVNEEFIYVSKNINSTKNEINLKSSQEFFSSLKEPIDKVSLEMNEQEELISSQIFALQNRDEDIEVKRIEIQNKINTLNSILGTLV